MDFCLSVSSSNEYFFDMRTYTDAVEQGTLIVKALEMAMDKDFMGAAHGHAAEELVGAAIAATKKGVRSNSPNNINREQLTGMSVCRSPFVRG